jgi:hypothetical protein
MELVLDRLIYITKLNYSVLLFSGLNVVFQQNIKCRLPTKRKLPFQGTVSLSVHVLGKASRGVEVQLFSAEPRH